MFVCSVYGRLRVHVTLYLCHSCLYYVRVNFVLFGGSLQCYLEHLNMRVSLRDIHDWCQRDCQHHGFICVFFRRGDSLIKMLDSYEDHKVKLGLESLEASTVHISNVQCDKTWDDGDWITFKVDCEQRCMEVFQNGTQSLGVIWKHVPNIIIPGVVPFTNPTVSMDVDDNVS